MALGVDHPGVATLQLELQALARADGRLSPYARFEDGCAVAPRFGERTFQLAHSAGADPRGRSGAQLDAQAAVLGVDGQGDKGGVAQIRPARVCRAARSTTLK